MQVRGLHTAGRWRAQGPFTITKTHQNDLFSLNKVGVLLNKVGVLLNKVGVLLNKVGVLLNKVGVLLNKVGVLLNKVGVSLNKVGVLLNKVGVLLNKVGVLCIKTGLPRPRLAVHLGHEVRPNFILKCRNSVIICRDNGELPLSDVDF